MVKNLIMEEQKPIKKKIRIKYTGHAKEHTAQTKKALLEVLKATHGNISSSCEKVGVNRKYFYSMMENDPEFAQDVADIKEKVIDIVESYALQRIRDGSDTMIIFFLKTQAKHRGYVERNELRHVGFLLNQDLDEKEIDQKISIVESKISKAGAA